MSPLGSRSFLRGASKLTSSFSKRPISSFNKTPPAANKGPNSHAEQAHPIGSYYEAIIVNPQPIPQVKPEEPPVSSPKSTRSSAKKTAAAPEDERQPVDTTAAPVPSPSAEPATAQEKARIIFGSRLAGPFERAERLQAIKDKSTMVAGILVPPKPEEPDNCCMSGCVNCVWDRFRDEMEEWVALSKEAESRLHAPHEQEPVPPISNASAVKGEERLEGPEAGAEARPVHGGGASEAASMDDDGGGSGANLPGDQPKISKDFWDEDLYKGVPVGIREFMKTEKKLKERHEKEGTAGG